MQLKKCRSGMFIPATCTFRKGNACFKHDSVLCVCIAEQKLFSEAQWKLIIMAHMAATLLALLLNYQASSEGSLSPPLNLSVELLDFKALARWLPGPGNPKGTRYSLEFVDIDNFLLPTWHQIGDCTNITSTECYFIFNKRVLTDYFVRVGAEWEEERSEWTLLPRSFQPYQYTLLSAPKLSVSALQNSICIILSHPLQSLMEVRMKFSVDLYQIISNNKSEHIAQNITTRTSNFVNLPPGSYCINAHAFLTEERSKINKNTTMCVFLHPDPNVGKVWVVIVVVFPLLSIPAVFGLIFIYYYVKPSKNNYIPKAMEIIEGTLVVRILNPEDLRVLPVSQILTDDCKATHQELAEDYYGGSEENYKEGLFSQIVDVADQDMLPVPDLYSTCAKMEEQWEYPTEAECYSDGLTLNTDSFSSHSQLNSVDTSQTGNMNDSVLFEFDEKSSFCYSENKESEAETESLFSDAVSGSNYEPRPDPRWMRNLQHHNIEQ
ncbi:cytokine receptor family member B12 isoform X2 [Tachysurus vachellii]|uniref:cytokine receptor family member B12 isoform X2 n=1 Tax=Tachysurus vachellii TaxID=175792 RepID=UPI00296AE612|nr:cytokine receptor family member B12 isoform X2 [Tachysurus vachellii]